MRIALLLALLSPQRCAAAPYGRPCLRLRGGIVRGQGYPYSPQWQPREATVEPRAPEMQRRPSTEAATVDGRPEMSEAERVYVVQQFERPEIQKKFLTRVFSIVFAQVLVTGLVMAGLRASPMVVFSIVRRLGYAAFLLPMIPLFWLQFSHSARMSAPLNYILLTSFTLLQGVALGAATLPFPTQLVLRAAAATAIATGGLTTYALTTRRDFTARGGMLTTGLITLLAMGIMQGIMGGSWLAAVHSSFGILLFCGFLVYNVQLMMGGGKKLQLRPDEHILGAITIYVDIINLFLYLLNSMSRSENS